MESSRNISVSASRWNLPGRRYLPKRIATRLTLISTALIIVTLGMFVLVTTPYQRKAILEAMESEARSTVTSIDQVTASAIITEDFGTVVEHCLRVVRESPSISYVVVTRNDGFSLIITKAGWNQDTLNGVWVPPGERVASSRFLKSAVSPNEVYHYTHPFQYSGIDWGWIHIGLSLQKFNHDINALYLRTALLALLCLAVGIGAALYLARKLTRPISILTGTTKLVAQGDLTAHADIHTGDELEQLGQSFNSMTKRLQKTQIDMVASREYTENIIRSMNDTMIVASPDGIIERVNTATLNLLGYGEEELIGAHIRKVLIAPEQGDNRHMTVPDFSDIASLGHLSNLETFYRSKPGQLIPVIFSAAVLHGLDNSVQGVVCVALDITNIKQSEEALRIAKETAESANRAKSQFLANMSHEIRTPMNGVLGLLSLLADSALGDQQKKMARVAHGSARNLLEVINNILDFSRIEAGKFQLNMAPFIPRDLVSEVMDLFWIRVQDKPIDLVCEIDDSIPGAVSGDAVRVRQVLINLVGNALKFTETGTVSLHMTLAETTSDRSLLRFEVRDSGPGISLDKQQVIFDPFSQVDSSMARRYEGTGLGLAICKELVSAMGGSIGVQSEPGKGSIFWFTIAAQHAEAVTSQAAEDEEAAENIGWIASGQPRVLLAEDNPVNQEFCRMVLESLNCTVDMVKNGVEAVEAVFSCAYDLVFMDCQMPEMDGYEATRIIRQRASEKSPGERPLIIVALTANAIDGDREYCLAAGMDDYLSKPFNLAQMRNMLRRWLENSTTAAHASIDPVRAGGTPDRPLPGEEIDPQADTVVVRPGAIDMTSLDNIRALQRVGAPSILDRVIRLYFSDSPSHIDGMRAAVATGDADRLWQAAHSFKSSSTNLGALNLAELCRTMEALGRSDLLAGAEELLAEIETEYCAACEALTALQNGADL